MIRHIFKKDIGILWPFALGAALTDLAVAVLRALVAAIQFRGDMEALNLFLLAGDFIATLFSFAVIAMVVQLDPIPGDRQDWLARPIRRRDMLFAKLLFVVVFVQIPLLAADSLLGLMAGFPLGHTLMAAGARNLYLFTLMTLPVMALAAMSNSVKQTLALGLAASVGALAVVGAVWELYRIGTVTPDGGHTMTSFVLQMAVLLVGAIAIIALQYFRRATIRARAVLALAAIFGLAAHLLIPQYAAYALEDKLSSSPGQTLWLAFAPAAGRLHAADDGSLAAGTENRTDQTMLVALPLAVTGLPRQMMLVGNTVRAILTAPDGSSVELGLQRFPLQMLNQSQLLYYQLLRVPGDFFSAHHDKPLRVELIYELAIRHAQRTYDMAAVGGELNIPNLGRCATTLNPFGTGVLLRCMQAGDERMYVSATLTDPVKGLSNPLRNEYWPSDAPYSNGDAMITRFGSILPFVNLQIAAHYPVGRAELPEAKVQLNVSEPATWLHRRMVIPNVRLDKWIASAAP